MINYRPILALIIISSGFLISISVVFLDMLGPDIPLPRKSISEILKSSSTSSEISIKKNANMTTTRKLAELYLDQKNLVHGYSNLDFNTNLSDIESGNFTFLSALCYGKSENDCIYFNAYLKSSDYGETWEIGFLERNTNI